MTSILLCYATMSGNTELAARLIEKGIKSEGLEVITYDLADMDATILKEYEAIILGSYTWGDGDLPDECLDFYDDLQEIDLHGKKVAIFGSGDSSYPTYCGAVDVLEKALKDCGAKLLIDKLKVELDPIGEEYDQCILFGQTFARQLKMELISYLK